MQNQGNNQNCTIITTCYFCLYCLKTDFYATLHVKNIYTIDLC